jgi:ankyrin repeat protein
LTQKFAATIKQPDISEHQYTALDLAIGRGLDVAALLIKHGANMNTSEPVTGDTPLHMAATANRKDLIELLLVHGADKYAINKAGWTPFARY